MSDNDESKASSDDSSAEHESSLSSKSDVSIETIPVMLEGPKSESNTVFHAKPHGFLSAPALGPIRVPSPDALSILSVDELAQLRPLQVPNGHVDLTTTKAGPAIRHDWRARVRMSWIRNKGLVYMVLSQICAVMMNVTTRMLEVQGAGGRGMQPLHIMFVRMLVTLGISSGYMWYRETPYFPLGMPGIRWLLVARGMGGFCGVFGAYFSLQYLPLAEITVLNFLAPGISCWACAYLLKEPFTRIEQIAGLISLFGVVLIARPTSLLSLSASASPAAPPITHMNSSSPTGPPSLPDPASYANVTSAQRLTAVGVTMIGVMGGAVVYSVLRWIGTRAHPLITTNYFAFVCFIVSTIGQTAIPSVGWRFPADLKEWAYLLFLGTCGFGSQFLLAAGLAYEKSSRATNMTYTQILFSLIVDKVIFGHSPGVWSLIGSTLILCSAITIALQQTTPPTQRESHSEAQTLDSESRVALMADIEEEEMSEDSDGAVVQSIPLRSLK